tara:strand:- start:644 stop:883 length:240 start_codon:yes stop_codon:yes gene_type:complete
MINLVSNALELTNQVIRMVNRRRSRKTIIKIQKQIEQIREMEALPYEDRIDSELDFYYANLTDLVRRLNQELETAKHVK